MLCDPCDDARDLGTGREGALQPLATSPGYFTLLV